MGTRRTSLLGRQPRRKSLLEVGTGIGKRLVGKITQKKSYMFGGKRPLSAKTKAVREARQAKWVSRFRAYSANIKKRQKSGEFKRMAKKTRFGGGRLATRPFYGNQHVTVAEGGTTAHRKKGKK